MPCERRACVSGPLPPPHPPRPRHPPLLTLTPALGLRANTNARVQLMGRLPARVHTSPTHTHAWHTRRFVCRHGDKSRTASHARRTKPTLRTKQYNALARHAKRAAHTRIRQGQGKGGGRQRTHATRTGRDLVHAQYSHPSTHTNRPAPCYARLSPLRYEALTVDLLPSLHPFTPPPPHPCASAHVVPLY